MATVGGGVVLSSHMATSDRTRYFKGQWVEHLALQQRGQFTDLLLVAAGVTVPVHQAILLPLSPLLANLVPTPCCWQTIPTVSLTNTDPDTLIALVEIVYSGRCYISTGLEYSRLLNLLETLCIDIQQAFSLHMVESPSLDLTYGFFDMGNIGVSIQHCLRRVDTGISARNPDAFNEHYHHKKFRASTPRDFHNEREEEGTENDGNKKIHHN
jgi:hypothetical protein